MGPETTIPGFGATGLRRFLGAMLLGGFWCLRALVRKMCPCAGGTQRVPRRPIFVFYAHLGPLGKPHDRERAAFKGFFGAAEVRVDLGSQP